MRPIAACAMVVAERTRVSQVTPESPGIPHAMVYGLYRALPGDRAFLPPSPALLSANLTPASGCQDHTSSPSASAPFVIGASAAIASRPASVTIASRPSEWDGTANHIARFSFLINRNIFAKGADKSQSDDMGRRGDLPVGQLSRP